MVKLTPLYKSEETLQMIPPPPETEFNPLNTEPKKGCYKSKLEQYLDILNILYCSGPKEVGFIMQQTEFNSTLFIENLSSLIKQKLVEKGKGESELVFSITSKGGKVVRFFGKAPILPSPI
jgi:predicted transcriptional regulator